MTSPFPGMDPYLEEFALWPDVQNSLAVTIANQLQPLLGDRYVAVLVPSVMPEIVPPEFTSNLIKRARQQTAAASIPAPLIGTIALETATRYLRVELRTVGEEQLITAIEVLSPVNKRPGSDAADAYDRKRRELFQSDAHLMEIDLLRGGRRPAIVQPLPDDPYFIFLSRAERRPTIEIWPVTLEKPIPLIPIPLRYPDADIPLDINAALALIYRSAHYDYRIDYRTAPPPPELASSEAVWVENLLRERGLRTD